jgi:hypothetical protein
MEMAIRSSDIRTGPVSVCRDTRWRTGSSSSSLPLLQLPSYPAQLPRDATSSLTSLTAQLYQVTCKLLCGPLLKEAHRM